MYIYCAASIQVQVCNKLCMQHQHVSLHSVHCFFHHRTAVDRLHVLAVRRQWRHQPGAIFCRQLRAEDLLHLSNSWVNNWALSTGTGALKPLGAVSVTTLQHTHTWLYMYDFRVEQSASNLRDDETSPVGRLSLKHDGQDVGDVTVNTGHLVRHELWRKMNSTLHTYIHVYCTH